MSPSSGTIPTLSDDIPLHLMKQSSCYGTLHSHHLHKIWYFRIYMEGSLRSCNASSRKIPILEQTYLMEAVAFVAFHVTSHQWHC